MAVSIIETQCKNHTEPLVVYHRRIISRRDIRCEESEYLLGTQCCKKCESGEYDCGEKSLTGDTTACTTALCWGTELA